MDPQVSIYYRGMAELSHDDLDGCLYDVIDRPKIKPLKATPTELRKYTIAKAATKTKPAEPSRLYANQRETDESVQEFRERLAGAIGAAPDAYFARGEIIRLQSELEASDADVEETALQIRQGSLTGVAPRNPGACFLYNRTCEFLGPCSGTESIDDPTKFKRDENVHPELQLAAATPKDPF